MEPTTKPTSEPSASAAPSVPSAQTPPERSEASTDPARTSLEVLAANRNAWKDRRIVVRGQVKIRASRCALDMVCDDPAGCCTLCGGEAKLLPVGGAAAAEIEATLVAAQGATLPPRFGQCTVEGGGAKCSLSCVPVHGSRLEVTAIVDVVYGTLVLRVERARLASR